MSSKFLNKIGRPEPESSWDRWLGHRASKFASKWASEFARTVGKLFKKFIIEFKIS